MGSFVSRLMPDFFVAMQKELLPTVSIEVGARQAEFSKHMKSAGVRTYAFEANPFSYEEFSKDFAADEYLNIAISDFSGTTLLKFASDNPLGGAHSLLTRMTPGSSKQVEVECTTLESFFNDKITSNDRIAMWIDVEGATREVFAGAKGLLPLIDSIFVEVENEQFWEDQLLSQDVIAMLEDQGFILISRDCEWFPLEYDMPRQENLIFVKKEKLHS